MSNKQSCRFKIVLLICFVMIVTVTAGCSEDKLFVLVEKQAKAFNYGDDPIGDIAIHIDAKAEGWEFLRQETKWITTGQIKTPYLITKIYLFGSPQNKDVVRTLTKTYIFDDGYFGWVPLYGNVYEINMKANKGKDVAEERMWQGDWDIPYFEKH